MVERDHARFGSIEAFFSESMRRDARSGITIVVALEIGGFGWSCYHLSCGGENKTYTSGAWENDV